MGREIMERPAPPADARLSYGPLPQQFGDVRVPSGNGPHPVVLLIHGGFWRTLRDLSHMGHLGAALAREGLASWNIEYRRLGEPGGGYPGTLEDVALGAAHLDALARTYALDLTRTVVLGFSAGGHLAFWLGAENRRPWRGVISLGGVVDLRHAASLRLGDGAVEQFLGATPESAPERYRHASPAERLPLPVPQRLIHGVDDDIVPIEISRRYVAAAGVGARLAVVPGAGHFEPADPASHAWPVVREAVLELLR